MNVQLFTAESISSPKESESETKYPNRTGNLERERADRRGGGVDGEERDLVDLGPEDRDLRVGSGKVEPGIAGGQLERAVVEERVLRRESDPEGKPVGPRHGRVQARRVHPVVVARAHGEHRNRHRQDRSYRRKRHRWRSTKNRHGQSRMLLVFRFFRV